MRSFGGKKFSFKPFKLLFIIIIIFLFLIRSERFGGGGGGGPDPLTLPLDPLLLSETFDFGGAHNSTSTRLQYYAYGANQWYYGLLRGKLICKSKKGSR